MHVFYLHGFASSAQSKKAAYFADRLRPFGIALRCPDFNQPDFQTLTMTRMIGQVADDVGTLDSKPVVLIGSSLGAAVAIHVAVRLGPRIDRLVLLAPALMFPTDASKVLGADRFERWSQTRTLDVFHYAEGVTRPLDYGFYEDGLQYDAFSADIRQPVHIFQGLRDEAVDHRVVEQFAAARPNVNLTLFDDDHQLMASLPAIWTGMAAFLGLVA